MNTTYNEIFLGARESIIANIVKRNRKQKQSTKLFSVPSLTKLAEKLERPLEDENRDYLASIQVERQDHLQDEIVNNVFENWEAD